MYKAMIASGMRVQNYGTVVVTLADEDKEEALPLIRRFYNMGFNIEEFGLNTIVIKSHPTWLLTGYEKESIEKQISDFFLKAEHLTKTYKHTISPASI